MAIKRPAPIVGQKYLHFKGTVYQIVVIAVHTETSEKLVVYQSLQNPERVFARPLDMFMSEIDRLRYPFVKAKYRFTLIEEVVEEEIITDNIEAEAEDVEIDADKNECLETNKEEEQSDTDTSEKIEPNADDTAIYKEDGELVLDPYVEAVLDEKEFSKKIENFEFLRGKCTEDMLTMIAISLDIQLVEGTIEEKYAQILKTLRMHEKYESARLRS